MAGRLAGKVAVVTASTAGIGRASGEVFAEEGAKVVFSGRRRDLGEQAARGVNEQGGEARYRYCDVSDSQQVKDLMLFALDEFGRVDVLMNNAWSGPTRTVMDLSEEDWDAALTGSVKAVAVASRCVIPNMIEHGGGSIVNTSSVHGVLAAEGNAAYNAFKAALINLSRQMAVDYGRHNIRVNALCPGRIVTESKEVMLSNHPEQVFLQGIVYPLLRPGTMRECAMAALFLACDESSFVTGHALLVDGGLTAKLQDATGLSVYKELLAQIRAGKIKAD
jgi:NAD(P)-dependent dehydrogenase (short-subunit alcohol dehydrogenase family)